MITPLRLTSLIKFVILSVSFACPAIAASGNAIDQEVAAALRMLYDRTPMARALSAQAKAILIFPNVLQAGSIPGAQGGEGALLKNGSIAGYYNTAGISVGLQANVQPFGYVLFIMNDAALKYVDSTDVWQIGIEPSIMVVDSGIEKTFPAMTARFDIYAFIFDQIGPMANAGLQGARITKRGR